MFIRISGQFTGILQLWLEQRGIHSSDLHSRLAQMAERETVPVEQWRSVLATAAALYPKPELGLEIGSHAKLRHIGVLGYLLLNCETLVDALQTYQLCERRFYSVDFCRLETVANGYRLAWPDRLGDENALFVQVALATLVTFMRQRFPDSCQLLRVDLTEQAPKDSAPYQVFFGCPVHFGSTMPGVTVDYALAAQGETSALQRAFHLVRKEQDVLYQGLRERLNKLNADLERKVSERALDREGKLTGHDRTGQKAGGPLHSRLPAGHRRE